MIIVVSLCFFTDVSVFHERHFGSEMRNNGRCSPFLGYFQIWCLFLVQM